MVVTVQSDSTPNYLRRFIYHIPMYLYRQTLQHVLFVSLIYWIIKTYSVVLSQSYQDGPPDLARRVIPIRATLTRTLCVEIYLIYMYCESQFDGHQATLLHNQVYRESKRSSLINLITMIKVAKHQPHRALKVPRLATFR